MWIFRRTRSSGAATSFNTLNNNFKNDCRQVSDVYVKLVEDGRGLKPMELLDNISLHKSKELNGNSSLKSNSDSTRIMNIEVYNGNSSDDSNNGESLTCNVCDRIFSNPKQLSSHKQKKRHYGCSSCDSIFPSLMWLEHHKEEFDHWSEDDEEDILTDSDDEHTTFSEEREKLL